MEQFPYLPKAQQDALYAGPALPHPDGIIPDLENPQNDNVSGYVVTTLLLTLGSLAFLIRLYVKIFLMRKVRLEEGKHDLS